MVKAMILCAGKGTRLLPITEKTPKPMVVIDGRPLLEYNVLLCKKYGIKDIFINTSHLPDKIKDYFGDGGDFGVNMNYSFEPELIGTSGALNNFRKKLDETFVLIYGDNISDINLNSMLEYHRKRGGIATLALRKKPKDYKTQSLILANDDLKLTRFIEKPDEETVLSLSGDFKLINSGIYIFEPEILKYIPEGFSDFAFDIFPKMISEGEEVYGFIMDEFYFREVGKIEKYDKAKQEIESGEIKLSFLDDE